MFPDENEIVAACRYLSLLGYKISDDAKNGIHPMEAVSHYRLFKGKRCEEFFGSRTNMLSFMEGFDGRPYDILSVIYYRDLGKKVRALWTRGELSGESLTSVSGCPSLQPSLV